MIYWADVKKKLLPHCPPEAVDWPVQDLVRYLNKNGRLSLKAIADLTEGCCGRTALFFKLKEPPQS